MTLSFTVLSTPPAAIPAGAAAAMQLFLLPLGLRPWSPAGGSAPGPPSGRLTGHNALLLLGSALFAASRHASASSCPSAAP